MVWKRDKPEEPSRVALLARATMATGDAAARVEMLRGQGMSVADAVRQIGVTGPIYDRWRRLMEAWFVSSCGG